MGEYRVLSVLTPAAGMSPPEFTRYWREVHAPLVLGLPHLIGYRQYDVLDEVVRPARTLTGPPIGGIAELVFDSAEGRAAAYATGAGTRLTADGAHFVAGGRSLHVARRTVL
jgi:uncharacterized protein (TIGR02118 family)